MPPDPSSLRLPKRITPCSIVNATVEVRFQTNLPPSIVPGLIYGAVRERFAKREETPEGTMPEALRAANPVLRYRPTVVLAGETFALHVGPRTLYLAMIGSDYPGWSAYRETCAWVMEKIRPLEVIKTPERLGLRYTDFFESPVKDRLQVDLLLGGQSQVGEPFEFTCHMRREGFQCVVRVGSSVLLETSKGNRPGCVLDVDLGFAVEPGQFWNSAIAEFDRAHKVQKRLFFEELLQPSFLATLNPQYD